LLFTVTLTPHKHFR